VRLLGHVWLLTPFFEHFGEFLQRITLQKKLCRTCRFFKQHKKNFAQVFIRPMSFPGSKRWGYTSGVVLSSKSG
jgi:hypothetical protein